MIMGRSRWGFVRGFVFVRFSELQLAVILRLMQHVGYERVKIEQHLADGIR